jgi:glycosyltransferase involved in cell wall biosynthesis
LAEPLSIAQVSPYAWEARSDVVDFVRGVSDELAGRGHRVVVIAPTERPALVRSTRKEVRAAREDGRRLLPRAGSAPRVLGVGELLLTPLSRRRPRSLPIDVARTVEEALTAMPLDVVHVHEPFAPSVASAALRHSRALNAGTFHEADERTIATQLGRRMTELVLGRLDVRFASSQATASLMERFYPAPYRLLTPAAGAPAADERPDDGIVRIAYAGAEERGALRLFLRALRRLPESLRWEATVWLPGKEATGHPALRSDVRERVRFLAGDSDPAEALRGADIAVAASTGAAPSQGLLLRALAAGAVPLVARIPTYEELLSEGERGLLFEPGDLDTLAGQLERLVADDKLRARLRKQAAKFATTLTWSRVADELEEAYGGLVARRHPADGNASVRARLRGRPLIDVDLHMHTDHSYDCATPVEVLLDTAREQGLGAIAVTDHNEISGALEARDKAAEFGVKVIVAEEVKTASQGEVIGLFIEEKIPRGMTLQETIAEIKRQGGLVYVPHPFDRLHSVPDYEHLLDVLDDVDAIEIFNPRVAFKPFNEEAARFAAKYRIVAGAGSDSHVAQGLGSVRIRMRDFDGPDEFLESLREADIVRRPTSLLYVQALKFIETKATPAPARAARKARRVRRASRKA